MNMLKRWDAKELLFVSKVSPGMDHPDKLGRARDQTRRAVNKGHI